MSTVGKSSFCVNTTEMLTLTGKSTNLKHVTMLNSCHPPTTEILVFQEPSMTLLDTQKGKKPLTSPD